MATNKQTYVTSYTTDVDPRTLPDYDPDNYNYVPQAASSYGSEGPRQRKKYVTTTVTTVTTTTIMLPKMQEAFVLPSTTDHGMTREIEDGRYPPRQALLEGPPTGAQVPRALPLPPPPPPPGSQPSAREGPYYRSPMAQPPRPHDHHHQHHHHQPPPPPPPPQQQQQQYQRYAPPSQGSYTPSSQRQPSSESRRDDSVRHLFPPGTVSAEYHQREGPGQNPYHSLPLRIDSRGPSSTASSAKKPPLPASAPVPRGAYYPPPPQHHQHHQQHHEHHQHHGPPPPPPPGEYSNGARALDYYRPEGPRNGQGPYPPPPPPPHQARGNGAGADPWAVSREVQLNPDGTVSKPWVFNQHNTKAVTTTATYDRPPTLEELGITSYFAEQVPTRRSAPYVASNPANGQPQPWVVDETREELEGGNMYRYQ